MYVKQPVKSCLLKMSVDFCLCLFIIKPYSKKDMFKINNNYF